MGLGGGGGRELEIRIQCSSKDETANIYHPAKGYPTIRFTSEISDKEITFLDTYVYKTSYKGTRFEQESILDLHTHFKPTETFQYTPNRGQQEPITH